MPRDMDRGATPHEARRIFDQDEWNREPISRVGNGLSERCQTASHASRAIRRQRDGAVTDSESRFRASIVK
jgi:hypothetical protein